MPLLGSDDFTEGLDLSFWEEVREGEEVGGALRLACTADYGAAETLRLYPVADTTYRVGPVARPDVGEGTTQVIAEVAIDADNKLAIYPEFDVINFQEIVGGVPTETTIEYDPVAHLWWQIRLDGSTVFWETSPDGETWTTRRTKAAGIDTGEIAQLRLLSGFYGDEEGLSPAYAVLDNVSIDGPLFAPVAVTGPTGAAPLTRSAPLTGTVNPRLSPASYYFEYGLTTAYGRQVPASGGELGAGDAPVPVSEIARGLSPNTPYHYRLVAEGPGGIAEGEDQTFTTSLEMRVGGALIVPKMRRTVFDASAIADYNQVHQAPGAITEVPDPLGGPETVLKLTVSNDDVAPITPTDNPRAQLLSKDLIRPGDVCRLRWKLLLPEDFPAALPSVGEEGGWFSLVAFYGPPFAGTGPWEISINGEDEARLTWQRNASYGFDIPWQIPAERGVWISGVTDFLFARAGWVRMSVNGDPVVFFDPETSFNPNDEEPGEELVMATRDSTNDGEEGQHNNHVKIANYRLHNMFLDPVTIYFGRLALERLAPVAVRA